MPEITETFFARDRKAWRAWLENHHASKEEIWLVFFKKHTGKPCVPYGEAVEEALCFGWIDGILKRVDDEKHVQRFTPRNPKSIWSESNKARVKKMIAEGRMTPAGQVLIDAAKRNGQWAKAGWRERAQVAPRDHVPRSAARRSPGTVPKTSISSRGGRARSGARRQRCGTQKPRCRSG